MSFTTIEPELYGWIHRAGFAAVNDVVSADEAEVKSFVTSVCMYHGSTFC